MDTALRNDWIKFEEACRVCTKCGLHMGRKHVVVGRGNPDLAKIVFIGEGPGEQEDQEGQAFIGAAGKLLNLALTALKFSQEDYYITNIVKCRPPKNREPIDVEISACLPWLRYQVKAIHPTILVCLGRVAAQQIIDKGFGLTMMRGNWVEKNGWLIMPTWHPAAVLRDETKKGDLFTDMKQVKQQLDRLKG